MKLITEDIILFLIDHFQVTGDNLVQAPISYKYAIDNSLFKYGTPSYDTFSKVWNSYLHKLFGKGAFRGINPKPRTIEKFDSLVQENKSLLAELQQERARTEVICEAIKNILAREGVLPPPKRVPIFKNRSRYIADEEQMGLEISDWHRGAKESRADLSGFAEGYSSDIADARLDILIEKVGRITDLEGKIRPIPVLNIWLTGDMVTGEDIFAGQRYVIDLPLLEQAIGGGKRLCLGISRLAQLFSQINVYCVPGNHGRVGRINEYHPRSNWDIIMYIFVQEWLKEHKNVSVNISASGLIGVRIFDHSYLAMHGDTVRSWMGIPYYGLERDVRKIQDISEVRWNVILCSHFHRPAIIPLGRAELIINGSICGATKYSIDQLKEAALPRQWCWGIHPQHAITWRYPLDLAEALPVPQPDKHGVLTPLLEID